MVDSRPAELIRIMASLTSSLDWLCQQLTLLKQHSDAAAAVKLPPELLDELSQLGENIAPRFRGLLRLCESARGQVRGPAGSPLPAEVAVYRFLLQGSTDGWLHEGMQQLGAKVWAAWPQYNACNDDRCMEMGGLTEHSCVASGRQACGGCRVSAGLKTVPLLL
jgi:hypothetical protein